MANSLRYAPGRWTVALMTMVATVSALSLCPTVRGDDPATPDANVRTPGVIKAELMNQYEAVGKLLADPTTLTDAAKRAATAPKAIPVFKKILADFSELDAADPAVPDQTAARAQFTMLLGVMGDADTLKALQEQADSKVAAVSLAGKSTQLWIAWLQAVSDETAASKVVDDAEKLATANPQSKALTNQLYGMSQLLPPGKPAGDRLRALVTGVMKNEVADQIKKHLEAEQKPATTRPTN